MRQLYLFLLLTVFCSGAGAQAFKQRMAFPGQDSVWLSANAVVESSIKLHSTSNKFVFYRLSNGLPSYLVFSQPLLDTVNISFAELAVRFDSTYQRKDTSLIIPPTEGYNPKKVYAQTTANENLNLFQGLNSRGNISRGVSVGSNQDAVLNSSLNLQLSGKLSAKTEIRASITDNNLPVQADGYTQQLREFDRLYMELVNEDFGTLRGGDYNINSAHNSFLQFDKRISGAGIYTDIKAGEGKIPIEVQAGLARGKFARNTFRGQEGNQGPYKLTGNNNESFIIIISGSERVYIDGILMTRGQQNDYVMDYNAGEITFTTLQPITKEKRIVVEFQYTDQNYLRSVVYGRTGYESENWKSTVQVYAEQDSKNQPINQELSDEEKRLLSNVGDDLQAARVSTIRASAYDPSLILYELKDTLGTDSVLVFSQDSTANLYFASFSFVGVNQAHYVLDRNAGNGRVFRYVAPVNGVPQGSYAPVRSLIAPNKLQVFTSENEVKIGDGQRIRADLAISKNEVNSFSDIDKGNDIGGAGSFAYQGNYHLPKGELQTALHYEFNQENFRTIERIRNVEFARDWNLPLTYNGAVSLAGADVAYLRDSSRFGYGVNFLESPVAQGFKNDVSTKGRTKKLLWQGFGSWLQSEDTVGNTRFLREEGMLQYFVLPKFWVGARTSGEWNERRYSGDSIRNGSYAWLQYQPFIGFGDSTASYAEISYLRRYDDTATSGRFERFSVADVYGAKARLRTNFNSDIQLSGTYRKLRRFTDSLKALENTITARANYNQRFFKNSIVSTTFYETGAGTEPRRVFSYVEVPAGTGIYFWTDYNGNGIQELDEFEVAPNQDQARFIRIFQPVNEYIRAGFVRFGQSLNINAPGAWNSKKGMLKTLSKLSMLTNYQLDRKSLIEGSANGLNPFEDVEDSLLVSQTNSFTNTVFVNRGGVKWGGEYGFRLNENQSLLSYGVEMRKVNEHNVNGRLQLWQPLLVKNAFSYAVKDNISEFFVNRNFNITEYQDEASLSYQGNESLVFTASYGWAQKTGISASDEEDLELLQQDFGLEGNLNKGGKYAALVKVNYILNDFSGSTTNPAAFEILEGLRPGKNITAELNVQRTLLKNILITLVYNTRISEDIFPVHTGSVQVKAFF